MSESEGMVTYSVTAKSSPTGDVGCVVDYSPGATGVRWDEYGSLYGQFKDGRTIITATDMAGNRTEATVEGTWGLDYEVYSNGLLIPARSDGVRVAWSNGETSVFLPREDGK